MNVQSLLSFIGFRPTNGITPESSVILLCVDSLTLTGEKLLNDTDCYRTWYDDILLGCMLNTGPMTWSNYVQVQAYPSTRKKFNIMQTLGLHEIPINHSPYKTFRI